MKRMRSKEARGFTLIELLVVISVITIIATATVMLVGGFLKGTAVKEGGRIITMAFAKTRQLASTKRMVHFLVFDFTNINNGGEAMSIYEDTNRDKKFSNTKAAGGAIQGGDVMAGELISLPPTVQFDKVFGQTQGAPFAAFQPDGSVLFYQNVGGTTIVSDVSWTNLGYAEGSASPPSSSDIVLRLGDDTANAPDKLFCDVVGLTGLLRKMEYFHKDDTITWP